MSQPPPPAIPPVAKGLALVSLANDAASEMVYPLLPALVTTELGGGALVLGVLDGSADLTAALLRWVSGRFADHPRWRARLLVVGYGLAIIVRPVIALTAAAWQVVGLRVLDRAGKGLRSPARDGLMADVTPPALHGRAFGLHRAADHFGAVLGAVAAWALVSVGRPVREVIAWSLLPGAVTFVVLLGVLRAVRVSPSAAEAAGSQGAGDGADAAPPRAGAAAIVALALLGASRVPETLLLLRLQDLGVAVALIPLIWGALSAVRSAAAYPSGAMADRMGPVPVLALGALLYAAGLASMGATQSALLASATFMGVGLAGAILEPVTKMVVARAGGRRRGRAFGNHQALQGVGALAAGVALGGAYERWGAGLALGAGAVLVLATLPAALILSRRLPLAGDEGLA